MSNIYEPYIDDHGQTATTSVLNDGLRWLESIALLSWHQQEHMKLS